MKYLNIKTLIASMALLLLIPTANATQVEDVIDKLLDKAERSLVIERAMYDAVYQNLKRCDVTVAVSSRSDACTKVVKAGVELPRLRTLNTKLIMDIKYIIDRDLEPSRDKAIYLGKIDLMMETNKSQYYQLLTTLGTRVNSSFLHSFYAVPLDTK